MNREELNEQLAELCGLHLIGHFWYPCENPGRSIEPEFLHQSSEPDNTGYLEYWNPTTDLNQLKMCYEALNPSEQVDFWQDSRRQGIEVQTIFMDTELVAQAILKAKGVSL